MPDFRNFNQDTYDEDTRIQRLKLRRTRKGRLFRTILGLLVILVTLAYVGFVHADGLWVYLANNYFDNRINAMGVGDLPGSQRYCLNIMLVGVDQREDEPSRSDTLMLAMLNLKDKAVDVISIPRDTRVKIEGLAQRTKINHAHTNGGPDLTKKTVEQLLGVPVHNYIETNFQGFENIIDMTGGVDLDVEKKMYYPSEHIDLKKGQQHLNGYDALAYVRYRSDGKGDIPRIERQHKFLKALADQILQPATILKMPQITGQLHSNINTDMSVQDLLVLVGEFKNINSEKIRFFNIPGKPEYIGGASYFVVDEDRLKVFMDDILNGRDPLQDPTGDNADANAGVPRERE